MTLLGGQRTATSYSMILLTVVLGVVLLVALHMFCTVRQQWAIITALRQVPCDPEHHWLWGHAPIVSRFPVYSMHPNILYSFCNTCACCEACILFYITVDLPCTMSTAFLIKVKLPNFSHALIPVTSAINLSFSQTWGLQD